MWTTTYDVMHECQALRLLVFRYGLGTPSLIVPPQAGHHSALADYGDGQSLVQSALNNTSRPVLCIEWKPCTFTRRNESISDLLAQLGKAVYLPGQPCDLVGLCQGGWLAAIFAAMYPSAINSLTVAGTPIDTHAGDSVLHPVVGMPLAWFQALVALGGGLMRGQMMLAGWKSNNLHEHYINRHLNSDERKRKFYRWYDHTQDLAGSWYLWAIDKLFKRNLLGQNKLSIEGVPVDLNNLDSLSRVNIVTGRKDDITPPEQSLALLRYTDAHIYTTDGGHIGLFMGRSSMPVWDKLFRDM